MSEHIYKRQTNKLTQMKKLLGMASFGIWDWRIPEDVLIWDDQMYKLYGISSSDFSSAYNAWQQSLFPEDKVHAERALATAVQGGEPFNTLFRVRWPNGDVKHIRAMAKVTFNADGQPVSATGINWDVTPEERNKLLFQTISEIQAEFLSKTPQTELIKFIINKLISFTESHVGFIGLVKKKDKRGYNLEVFSSCSYQTCGITIPSFKQSGTKSNVESILNLSVSTPLQIQNCLAFPIASPEGIIAYVGLANRVHEYSPSLKTSIMPLLDAISNIISSSQNLQRIEKLAQHDKLTGLYNRNYFELCFEQVLKEHKQSKSQFALLLLDINNFKSINDLHGHVVGDKALKVLGEKLKNLCDPKTIISRMGGDEFTVIMPYIHHAEDAIKLAKKLHSKLQSPFTIENITLFCRPSMGISIYPDSAKTTNKLLSAADLALYEAKDTSYIKVFDKQLEKSYHNNYKFERDLVHALKQGLIYFDYQPIIEIKQHKIVGVEALARWTQPNQSSTVPPEKFIRKIEDLGLASELNDYVVSRVLEDAKQLKTTSNIYISVNLSPKDVYLVSSVDQLIKKLKASSNSKNIEFLFELTETGFISQQDSAELIHKMQKENIRIAIDDFGIKASSPLRFVETPFDVLKMDRAFIQQLTSKDAQKKKRYTAFIKSVIEMCQALSIKVIAEGVENRSQVTLLQSFGCNYIQGNLYYKPMDIKRLNKLLK